MATPSRSPASAPLRSGALPQYSRKYDRDDGSADVGDARLKIREDAAELADERRQQRRESQCEQ